MVIANNSPQDAIEIPTGLKERVRVMDSGGNVGFARGINLAFEGSTADYLLVVNPDLIIGENFFEPALRFLESEPKAGAVFPKLLEPGGGRQRSVRRFYTWPVALWARCPLRALFAPRFFGRYLMDELDGAREPVDVDWGLGAAVFLRRAALEDGPVFDPRYFLYFEDVDLCMRLWRSGWRVAYLPEASCVHGHRRASANPLGRAARYHAASFLKFVRKWRGLPGRPAAAGAPVTAEAGG